MKSVKTYVGYMFKIVEFDAAVIGDVAVVDINGTCFLELFRAVLHQNAQIDGTHMPVMKVVFKICSGAVVLSHDHICHIAVTPLPGKIIASLLHLHIHDASVGKLHDDVHHDKGAFLSEVDSFSR